MTSDLTPESVRGAQFRTTLRGLDRTEVEAFLTEVAARVEELEGQTEKLAAQLESSGSKDLEGEFESVGREVTSILQSAREAADSMRERATLDAANWRSEAMEEADNSRKDASADAEALRRDAWVTGSQLLEQSAAAAETMRATAERDVLTIMGEAEREAHRLTSGARREAEDVVRNATMESEKITNQATSRRDDIIDAANRQAAAAQERTRALEQRRDELLNELENVRSTLTRLEGSLDERREALDLSTSEPSSVKVVHPPSEPPNWELGETVRVVPPDDSKPDRPDPGIAEEVAGEVTRMRGSPAPPAETSTTPAEPLHEPAAEPEQAPVSGLAEEVRPDEGGGPDDLTQLFAALRDSGENNVESASGDSAAPDESQPEAAGVDWLEVRESKLLPITNRAVRGVRKSITEIQNVALDSLRTETGWAPDRSDIIESIHADLLAAWSESFAAGHSVAEEMIGSKLKRPKTPKSTADQKFAEALAGAVEKALETAGDEPKSRQSAASRVFRVWRSDEAERRIRDVALTAYETGLEKSRPVTADA